MQFITTVTQKGQITLPIAFRRQLKINPYSKVIVELTPDKKIITIEEGSKSGGFGSAVLEFANESGYKNQIKILGIPDKFIAHGTVEEQRAQCLLDKEGILNVIKQCIPKQRL